MSDRISPTAHFTGYIWYRHGLGVPALRTRTGAVLHGLLNPVDQLYHRVAGGHTLTQMLLARHRAIDEALSAAIEAGQVSQVFELAAGMSPRGQRLTARYPELRYVEADLPAMAARKRQALFGGAEGSARHRVVDVDALAESGPLDLRSVGAAHLDLSRGTAVITEGLISYFERPSVFGLWERISELLSSTPHGLYLSSIHLRGETGRYIAARVFRRALEVFARGSVHFHYDTAEDAAAALGRAGFTTAELLQPTDGDTIVDLVRIIRATT